MKYIFFSLLLLSVFCFSCSKSSQEQYIPTVSVYYQFDLNDPLYSKLNYANTYVYMDNLGVRGLIVANYGGVLYALERDCPYNPNDACAKVSVESGGLTIRCGQYDANKKWVACCNSKFQLNGTLTEGPAKYSLKTYNISANGSTVTISN